MKLPFLAIRNYKFTIILVVLFVLNGIVSFLTMPKYEDPLTKYPFSQIVAINPGATAEDIEELIIEPVEAAINEVEGIKDLTSTAVDGVAGIQVEFYHRVDIDRRHGELIDKVNEVRNELPDDMHELTIEQMSVLDVNIMQIALISQSGDYVRLEEEAKSLEKDIRKINGVRGVEIHALPEREVRIAVDVQRMAQFNLPLDLLIRTIQSTNANIPAGSIDMDSKRFTILTSGSYESLDEIRNTILISPNHKEIKLSEVADVYYTYEDDEYLARLNDQKAVWIGIQQKGGMNIYNIVDDIKSTLQDAEAQLPTDVKMVTFFDQSIGVHNRISSFFMNYLQGILLVGFFVLLAVGFRAGLIVMLAVPISALLGLTVLDFSGFGLQQLSIAGLIVALGLLVDSSIAVVENIARYMELGYNRKEAAIKGTQEIGWALVSSTVTTVLAFLPMTVLYNPTGDFIRSMALIVIYTLIAALILALTFTPYLSSVILKLKKSKSDKPDIIKLLIKNQYTPSLDFALKRPVISIVGAILVFVSSILLFNFIGVSFFPKAEKAMLIVEVETPLGTNLDKTNQVARYVEKTLREYDQVVDIATNVGHGNPQLYYNMLPKSYATNFAQLIVRISEYEPELMARLINQLRNEFDDYPNASIEVKQFEQGPPVEAPIAIKIKGKELDQLKRVSMDVQKIIRTTPGALNVDNPVDEPKTDLYVNINESKARSLGVSIIDIDRAILANIGGITISEYHDPNGEIYDMVVRMKYEGHKPVLSDFERVYITSSSGAQIKLSQVADIEFKESTLRIEHFDRERVVTVTADVNEEIQSIAEATQHIVERLDNYNFPKGMSYYVGGESESRDESFGGLGKALLMALIAIFAVLVLQFRSFTQPLIIYSAIPLSVTGAFFALFITGYSFSFTAFVGLTSLVGIVVNDSIILVDYTNQLRYRGVAFREAIIEAGQTRFMPIILTTITTVAGLLPLTLRGGDMWAPMGWSIIGGLIVSTFLTLIIVPVFYKIFSDEKADLNNA
ncbi:MAG: MMPL family transporter [Bacteroidetes bacterium]|jgi:multidrug efflux pump subunit AcrB|nr:MMPL family transporter [Bacteroidota bacterium]